MSTESTTTAATETTSSGGETFTPEETAYLKAYESGSDPAPAPAAKAEPTQDAKAETKTGDAQTGDDALDNELVVDDAGNIRDKKTGRWVPQQALHAERTRRKALESQLSEKDTKLARLDERMNILNEALTGGVQQQQAEVAPPDPATDIFGYLKYLGEKVQGIEKKSTAEIEQTQRRLDDTETATTYRNDAMAFAKETPTFGPAYMHLVQKLDAELEMRGMSDPKQRMQQIAAMEREEVAFARKSGKRPAEWIYNLALARGFSPPAKGGETKDQPTTEQTPANSAAASKLEAVQRGQDANTTLSATGGGASAPLTAEALANMSEHEFAALLAKTGDKQNAALRKLLGG